MKKRTRVFALLMTVALLFTLAACGGNGTEDPSAAPTGESGSAAAQDVTLNVAALKGPTGIGMVKLMQDAKNGKIDLIITKSVSRFARNTAIVLKASRELKERNVGIFFELQNINTLFTD
mgnify:CR=1 FL=1